MICGAFLRKRTIPTIARTERSAQPRRPQRMQPPVRASGAASGTGGGLDGPIGGGASGLLILDLLAGPLGAPGGTGARVRIPP